MITSVSHIVMDDPVSSLKTVTIATALETALDLEQEMFAGSLSTLLCCRH